MLDTLLANGNNLIFEQLVLAMVLGALLGLERSIVAGKSAGVRTYALVSVGATLFVISAQSVLGPGTLSASIMPLAAGIVTGVGFLGAGLIIKDETNHPHGLTTAAGLWVSAAIGMAVAFKLFLVATFATFLTLFIFNALWFVEYKLKRLSE